MGRAQILAFGFGVTMRQNYFSAVLYRSEIEPKVKGTDPSYRPGILDPYFGRMLIRPRIKTTKHGFGTLTANIGSRRENIEFFKSKPFCHVEVRSFGVKVFEGRLEQPTIQTLGGNLVFVGYYNSLDDLPYQDASLVSLDIGSLMMKGLKDLNYGPQLSNDYSMIREDTGLTIGQDSFDGGETLKDIAEIRATINDSLPRPIDVAVWDNRQVWVQAEESYWISYKLPISALKEQPVSKRDFGELWTGGVVIWEQETDKEGGGTTRTRVVSPIYRDPNFVRESQLERIMIIPGTRDIQDESQAKQLAESHLKRLGDGTDSFSVNVYDKVLSHNNCYIEPQFMRAGTLVALPTSSRSDMKRDSYNVGFVREVDWDVETKVVTLQIDPMPNTALFKSGKLGSSGITRLG